MNEIFFKYMWMDLYLRQERGIYLYLFIGGLSYTIVKSSQVEDFFIPEPTKVLIS